MRRSTSNRRSLLTILLVLGVGAWLARPGTCEEALKNGDFSGGRAGWELAAAHGALAGFTVDPTPRLRDGNCAKLTVTRPTFTGWQIALHSEVNLERGKRYRVAFHTVAEKQGHLELCVRAVRAPCRVLQLARIAVDETPRSYSFLTPPVPEDGPMRVGFWFGNSPKGAYWLDGVLVEELSAEGTARLERVPKGFENGDFNAGVTGWELRTHRGVVAQLSVDPTPRFGDGNCGKVTVTKSTDTSWHIQLMQIFTVKKGKRYAATFSAMADRPVAIRVAYQVPPPDNEALSTTKLNISTEPTTCTVTSPKAKRDSDMKLAFHLSAVGEHTFWIDKVILEQLPEPAPQQDGPQPRTKDTAGQAQ